MNKFEKLIELNKEFDGILINDYTDVLWFETDHDIQWNGERNYEDLINGDGDTYSGETTRNFCLRQDGYLLIEMFNDFGGTCWNLFKLENKVEEPNE